MSLASEDSNCEVSAVFRGLLFYPLGTLSSITFQIAFTAIQLNAEQGIRRNLS